MREKGFRHLEETKKKIRKSLKGHKCLKKTREKIRKAMVGCIPWNKGIPRSLKTKRKLSKSMRGEKNHNWGKHRSKEVRIKIGIAHSGRKCNFWKGGISKENERIRKTIEFHLWREAVFTRDNWTCQKYHIKGGKLHPHHILNFAEYPELRFAIDNGITLSEKAHREFHKKYGFKNNTKEQMKEFLKDKNISKVGI